MVLLISAPSQSNQPVGAVALPQAIIDPAGKSGATAEAGSLAIDVCAKTFLLESSEGDKKKLWQHPVVKTSS